MICDTALSPTPDYPPVCDSRHKVAAHIYSLRAHKYCAQYCRKCAHARSTVDEFITDGAPRIGAQFYDGLNICARWRVLCCVRLQPNCKRIYRRCVQMCSRTTGVYFRPGWDSIGLYDLCCAHASGIALLIFAMQTHTHLSMFFVCIECRVPNDVINKTNHTAWRERE